MKKLLLLAFLLSVPLWAVDSITAFPPEMTMYKGGTQSLTALVNGTNDNGVTFALTTNPGGAGSLIHSSCPSTNLENTCTAGFTSAATGTYVVTATMHDDGTKTATFTITVVNSPTVATGYPRLYARAADAATMRAKSVGSNPQYVAIQTNANYWLTYLSSALPNPHWQWTFNGGNGQPDPSATNVINYNPEIACYWFAVMSWIAPTSAERDQWGSYAHDTWMWWSGFINADLASNNPTWFTGNNWSDIVVNVTAAPDFIMAGGYLNSSEIATTRTVMQRMARSANTNSYGGGQVTNVAPAVLNTTTEIYDDSFAPGTVFPLRATGSNYTVSKQVYAAAAAFLFDDNTTDDPPQANSCSATRYQICNDRTVGSLHAWKSYLYGAMLFRAYLNWEDPNVSVPAINSFFGSSTISPVPYVCNIGKITSYTPIPCLGRGRGGVPLEGTWYGYSIFKTSLTYWILHNSGNDDPLLYGPQAGYGTSSWWELYSYLLMSYMLGKYQYPFGGSSPNNWTYVTTGDTNLYYRSIGDWQAVLTYRQLLNDLSPSVTTKSEDYLWGFTNSVYNFAGGGPPTPLYTLMGNVNLRLETADLQLFLSLPANRNLQTSPPTNPRSSYPTDSYDLGAQMLFVRDGFGTSDNTFLLTCNDWQIDHEKTNCGSFSIYTGEDYVTKQRTTFNDGYDLTMSTAPNSNMPAFGNNSTVGCGGCEMDNYGNPPTSASYIKNGGQYGDGAQLSRNFPILQINPAYVSWYANTTPFYNMAGHLQITNSWRSVLYDRINKRVVLGDGVRASAADFRKLQLVSTGPVTISGTRGNWTTRTGHTDVYATNLLPAGATISAATLDAGIVGVQEKDWEPSQGFMADAGFSSNQNFLTVLEWGAHGYSPATSTLVTSTAGTSYDFALSGTDLYGFAHDPTQIPTTTTFPASGATHVYLQNLKQNNTYNITGTGTPASAVTDNAGTLAFTMTGTGSITVADAGICTSLPTVTLTNPAAGSTKTSLPVAINATASSNCSGETINSLVVTESSNTLCTSATGTCNANWNPSNAVYSLTATATDTVGNTNSVTNSNVTVNVIVTPAGPVMTGKPVCTGKCQAR